ncbi:hypothetical protein CQ018_09930 [Arthrobacter sp. MYb227]|uniref:hypothetical protein n=1 Tax=Arthrobacter sp. MYb227 TaxID=1848601 RepID=UPI000CFD34AF|nr:hypothetical protein [Arthrobacter sp. MYb227]PQZ92795.1 hypothetical protein CQ018_09930 [Arthrobacter sp. MYb227]
MTTRPRILKLLALGCAAVLSLSSCSAWDPIVPNRPIKDAASPAPTAPPGTNHSLQTRGRGILETSLDSLEDAYEVKVATTGSLNGVPFEYTVSGDYEEFNTQAYEMRQGPGHVSWLADSSTGSYYVKANKQHGYLINPTDNKAFLNALSEDRWLLLPDSEYPSMILVSDEIDDLTDFLEEAIDTSMLDYLGLETFEGVSAHRFNSANATLWLAADDSALPLRLQTVAYDPYMPMVSDYRDWNQENFHKLPEDHEIVILGKDPAFSA